jgi:hypothetical protein
MSEQSEWENRIESSIGEWRELWLVHSTSVNRVSAHESWLTPYSVDLVNFLRSDSLNRVSESILVSGLIRLFRLYIVLAWESVFGTVTAMKFAVSVSIETRQWAGQVGVWFPAGAGNLFFPLHRVETDSSVHSASYLMWTGGSFPESEAIRACSWSLTSI